MISETGKHAPPTSTKQPDTNKNSRVRKQWTRLEKIIWPVAPDGYIPNSVVRSLAPYPQFKRSSANRGLQIKEEIEEDDISAEQKRLLKYFLEKYGSSNEEQQNKEYEISLEHGIQSEPGETNITPSLINKSKKTKTGASLTPHQTAVPQSQNLLQDKQKSLQQNASSVDELKTNAPSVDELQTNASSVDDIQMKDSSVNVLQTNASSVEEQKNKEEGEKDQSLCEKSNAFSSKQPEKVKTGQKADFKPPETVSVSPKLLQEQKPSDSANKSVHVLDIGAPKQTMRKKADSPLKKLKSLVSPLPLLGNRRPNSVLFYLYKRSKAEKASEGETQAPKVA